MTSSSQKESGLMIYPQAGWRKVMFKAPIYLWRLGLARLLPANFLLLTTRGRKSGAPRHTMVEYTDVNGRIYLSSGWGLRPQWCQNILASPFVTAQTVRSGTLCGQAVRVTDPVETAEVYLYAAGHSPAWKDYLAAWGIEDNVDDFVAKRDRMLILRIDPLPETPPLPLTRDLLWVWPALGAIALAFAWLGQLRKTR